MHRIPSRTSVVLAILLAGALSAQVHALAAPADPEGKETSPERRYVLILIYPGVYNTEFMAPYDVFDHAGHHMDGTLEVVTVAADRGPVRTYEGLQVLPDHTFEDAPPAEILIVPSGENSERDMADDRLVGWIRDRARTARLTISHCWGAFLLAKAGLLDGVKATTFPPDVGKLGTMFPEIQVVPEARFVDAGRVITSAGGVYSFDASLYAVLRRDPGPEHPWQREGPPVDRERLRPGRGPPPRAGWASWRRCSPALS
jgi:transcriptional regulator GlxA family with amidase domain